MSKTTAQLIPLEHREAYGGLILRWLDQAIAYYSDNNWRSTANGWECEGLYPKPTPIIYEAGDLRLRHEVDLTLHLKTAGPKGLAKARQKVWQVASELLREGTTEQRKKFRNLKKERKDG